MTEFCVIVLPRDRLSYDTWTSILPDKATPAQAQTDLPLGKARIPKNWSLKLVSMPANFLCMLHHDHCHVAVSKLFPFTLITKRHTPQSSTHFLVVDDDDHVLQLDEDPTICPPCEEPVETNEAANVAAPAAEDPCGRFNPSTVRRRRWPDAGSRLDPPAFERAQALTLADRGSANFGEGLRHMREALTFAQPAPLPRRRGPCGGSQPPWVG
eukprot:scaffold28295_cov32-Phaeocystis_antarctica.AAC.1